MLKPHPMRGDAAHWYRNAKLLAERGAPGWAVQASLNYADRLVKGKRDG